MAFTMTGKWAPRTGETTVQGDSTLMSRKRDHAPFEQLTELTMGTVVQAEPEPGYVRVSAVCDLDNGFRRNQCAWPGPNVAVGVSGKADGSRAEIHGFYDAPLPGQAVLLGYVNGRSGSPIVVQKYSSRITQEPHLEGLYDLPLTNQSHDYRDVLIGSFTGSLIALRGGVPIPGQIDIVSAADTTITASAGVVVEAGANIEFSTEKDFLVDAEEDVEIVGATVGLGPEPRQPVLKGNDVATFLFNLIDAIQNITQTVQGANTIPPLANNDAFETLKSGLEALKSLTVTTN